MPKVKTAAAQANNIHQHQHPANAASARSGKTCVTTGSGSEPTGSVARRTQKKKTLTGIKRKSQTQRGKHLAEGNWRERRQFSTETINSQSLQAVSKADAGRCQEVTIDDVVELLAVLHKSKDPTAPQEVAYDDVEHFLTRLLAVPCFPDEVEALWDAMPRNEDDVISAEDLAISIQSGAIKQLITRVQQEEQVMEMMERKEQVTVSRDVLCEWVEWRLNRDDAFITLPFALAYLVIFVCLVQTHLRIWERSRVETGIEDWVLGYSKDWGGPYIKEHVNNIGSFWTWLDDTGLPSILSGTVTRKAVDEAGGEVDEVGMAFRHLFICDIKLVQQRKDGQEVIDWLLHSSRAQGGLGILPAGAKTELYLQAATDRSRALQRIPWADLQTTELELIWCNYNERVHFFSRTVVKVIYDKYGVVTTKVTTTAVPARPYRGWGGYVVIPFYLFCIVYPMVLEGKELSLAIRHGRHAFIDYWGLWNFVDWTTVLTGILSMSIWIRCCIAINSEFMQDLLDNDLDLLPGYMNQSVGQMQDLFDAMEVVIRYLFALHITMSVTLGAIVLKLFKSFQSNARLSVVTDTVLISIVDVIHFFLVFSVIFVSFSIVGHILFGADLDEFNSFGQSMTTAFMVLMGDFGWHVDHQMSVSGFGSGMPSIFVTVWYLTYITLVLLVLLNMLLGVLLDKYAVISGKLEGSAEAPTLWLQIARYSKRRKQTKGFFPLAELEAALNNPAVHPGDVVTEQSLLDAFCEEQSFARNMKPENAKWLMKFLENEAKARQPKENMDDVGAKLKSVEEFTSNIAEELHVCAVNVSACKGKVDTVESRMTHHFGHLRTSKTFSQLTTSASSQPSSPGGRFSTFEAVVRHTLSNPSVLSPTNSANFLTPATDALGNTFFTRFSEQVAQLQARTHEISWSVEEMRTMFNTWKQNHAEPSEHKEEKYQDPKIYQSMQASNTSKPTVPKSIPSCLSTTTYSTGSLWSQGRWPVTPPTPPAVDNSRR